MKSNRKLMSRAEAASYLGLRPRTLYSLVCQGAVPAVRVGRVIKFEREQLDAWRRAQTTASAEAEPVELSFQAVNLGALAGVDQLLAGAMLAELREIRRLLVRASNRLAGGAR